MPNTTTLTWSPRFAVSEYRIYRSTGPFDFNSLPAPVATLGGDVTSYVDATVADSATYYWLLAADNSESPAATVYSKGQITTGGEGGGGPPPVSSVAGGFRANRDGQANQSISGGVTSTIIFANEVFDTDGGYDPATGIYTVPAALDGAYMMFTANAKISSLTDATALIQIDGVAHAVHLKRETDRPWTTLGPIEVATGQEISFGIFVGSGSTVSTEVAHFSGYTV